MAIFYPSQARLVPCVWCRLEDPCDCYERLYCEQAGEVGHSGCGWCIWHQKPQWMCCWTTRRLHLHCPPVAAEHHDHER